MNILSRFNKPEYFFRPTQVLTAISSGRQTHNSEAIVTLPWGVRLSVNPREQIGRALMRLGVYDLCVSESIWRLLDPEDCAIDIGANLGYMTSLMAAKVGAGGSVESFEPHPDIYAKLVRNADRWWADGLVCTLSLSPIAVSSREGVAILRIPQSFADNEGLASLERHKEATGIEVPTRRLDDAIANMNISLMKIDVEGHELQVLLGAEALITNHQVRDILFEDESAYPTPTTDYLEKHGYEIYHVGMRFCGPVIAQARRIDAVPRREWEPKSYLATCAGGRAESRFRSKGWSVLRPR